MATKLRKVQKKKYFFLNGRPFTPPPLPLFLARPLREELFFRLPFKKVRQKSENLNFQEHFKLSEKRSLKPYCKIPQKWIIRFEFKTINFKPCLKILLLDPNSAQKY